MAAWTEEMEEQLKVCALCFSNLIIYGLHYGPSFPVFILHLAQAQNVHATL